MIVGTTIFRLDGNPVYSPEFSRGGLGVTFVVEVIQLSLPGATDFIVTIESRNRDETTWTGMGSFTAITAVGVATKDITMPFEVCRLKFTFASGTPEAADSAHILVQAPSWRPYA